MNLINIGQAVRARRAELGLSQVQLAHLSGLSRQTLVGLENGSLNDLGVNRAAQILSILGLDMPEPSTQARRKKRGLWMAAKTASVSYARELAPELLSKVLVSGEVPVAFIPHLAHLLDEAPISTIVMAVEEAASAAHVPPGRCGVTWRSWPRRFRRTVSVCGHESATAEWRVGEIVPAGNESDRRTPCARRHCRTGSGCRSNAIFSVVRAARHDMEAPLSVERAVVGEPCSRVF
jgi:transcriptional regulator with XRE-family HTH domain